MDFVPVVYGLDGGGTKTALTAATTEGTVLFEIVGKPSNFQIIGLKRAAKAIVALIRQANAQLTNYNGSLRAVLCGLTGAGRESDRERIRNAILDEASARKIQIPELGIESDARIALEGAFKGASGIIVIAGTGSIAFGKDSAGNLFRVGGWGRSIGDEGGGFAIGRDGLRAVARMLDGRGETTAIHKYFSTQLGLNTQPDIIKFLYTDANDPAVLAPLVLKAAEEEDPVAERILLQEATELSEHVGALLRAMEVKNKIPLALIGSLGKSDHRYGRLVRTKISTVYPQVQIQEPAAPPEFGSVLLAVELLRKRSASAL